MDADDELRHLFRSAVLGIYIDRRPLDNPELSTEMFEVSLKLAPYATPAQAAQITERLEQAFVSHQIFAMESSAPGDETTVKFMFFAQRLQAEEAQERLIAMMNEYHSPNIEYVLYR